MSFDAFDKAEENAAELRLGAFEQARCLTNSEVAIILANQHSKLVAAEKDPTPFFLKTYEYVQYFGSIANPAENTEALKEIRQQLEQLSFEREDEVSHERHQLKLAQFEIATLINLAPDDEAVATTFLPSLKRFLEEERMEMLQIVERHVGK